MDDTARELMQRAEHLRAIHDYDGAISAYERVVAADPFDAQARWGLVLSRYGIEFEHDERTGADVPVINRMSMDSILEDRDYLLALERADEQTAEQYRREARKIAALQEQLADIVRHEKPYDVFISFKQRDGRALTRDYALAQEAYDTLTAEGFRVFFSPVTLRAHLGEEYEPYIFSALYTAKVMVLVATTPEHVESTWVKNEWSRYLYLMRDDPKKHLLPVYEGMRPDAFPGEIARMQAINLAEIGAMRLVATRVRDLTGEREKIVYVRGKDGSVVNVTNLMRRIHFDIEDGEFEAAGQRIVNFISAYGDDYADLRYARLLCATRARNVSELSERLTGDLSRYADLQYVLEHGSDEQREALGSLAELRARREAQARIDGMVSAVRSAYENGKYAEAIALIDSLRHDPSFDREADVAQLYAMAKRQQEALDERAEFLALTKSGTYLRDRFRETAPNLYEKLLYVERVQAERGVGWELPVGTITVVICAAIIVAWFVVGHALETVALLVCLAVAFWRSRTFFEDGRGGLGGAATALLKALGLTFLPSIALTLIVLLADNAARNFDSGILATISRIWYRELDTDSAVLVLMYLPALIGAIASQVPVARREATTAKARAAHRAALPQARAYREELHDLVPAFEQEQRLRLEQEYGPYLEARDWERLKGITSADL